ncbi:MAG: membrane protein insertion efficiency factor YidD [Candidatus Falkowbacteria bacterium]|nr:membrane protein insertion efficiency factor YidD [Candidatus Falkowbacteria bacterium]
MSVRYFVVYLIKFYQKTLSLDHGVLRFLFPNGYCRFKPTCSEYAIDAIIKYGFFKGGLQAAYRVVRCNPWNRGGWDPVKTSLNYSGK